VPRPSVSDLVAVPVATSLPASPADGQEVDLLVDTAAAYGGPYLWRCKYLASAPAPYRWVVLAGAPMEDEEITNSAVSFGANAWGNITPDPDMTVPFAGVWEVALSAVVRPDLTCTMYMGVQVGGVDPDINMGANANAVYSYWPPGMQTGGQVLSLRRRVTVAASTRFLTRYRHNAAGASVLTAGMRCMTLLPVRLG